MKFPARIAALLLPFLLAGCFHKSKQSQVRALATPIEETAPPKPAPAPVELPPAAATIPNPPPAPDANAATLPQKTPKPPVKHKKPPAAKTTQQAENESSGVSAIGQLSSGDPSDLRRQTEDSIAATERGLNGIGRQLNDQEQKTAAQIREFLKQARAALVSGDVDGAHTLAAKAKVLLGELSR